MNLHISSTDIESLLYVKDILYNLVLSPN